MGRGEGEEKTSGGEGITIYCPQLGMVIDFTYCMSMNDGFPCRNSIGCWQERFDVIEFLKRSFAADDLRRIFGSLPKSRLERIMESMSSASKEE